MLSRLILAGNGAEALTGEELRDQLVTLLLAGHETTATALAWALYELGRDTTLLARTVAAADTGDEAWLEAVLKESMRLHPVIPMVVRTPTAPAATGDVDLPAQHLDPLRWRGRTLHRCRVLADGGRGDPARGADVVHAGDARRRPPRVRNITSVPRDGARIRVSAR